MEIPIVKVEGAENSNQNIGNHKIEDIEEEDSSIDKPCNSTNYL